MRPDDFFAEPDAGPLGSLEPPRFNLDLVRELRSHPVRSADDIEVAVGLARLIHDDLEAFGTAGGEQLTETQMRESLLALHAVLKRLGMTEFVVPFRDYKTFKSYWLRNDGYNSWQARRDILNTIFEPMHDALTERETQELSSALADAVSPRGRTGWTRVDEEIAELKRHFAQARTPQDYRNVGNDCVIVLEALGRQVYNADVHLRPGEDEPPIGNTKQRIGRFVEGAAPGSENAVLRKLVRSSIEYAQEVKHRDLGSRRDAGITADSVILLANLLRRLDEGN